MPSYSPVLNEDPKEVLSWMSPFEVYYGRKSNMVIHPLVGSPSSVIDEQSTNDPQSHLPSLKQRLRFEENQRRQRQTAKKATEHCHKRMIRYVQCKKNGSLCLMSPVQRDRKKKMHSKSSKSVEHLHPLLMTYTHEDITPCI